LDGSGQSEDEGELTVTKDEIEKDDDACEYDPIGSVLFLKDAHALKWL
jgi:hypothetical protein